MLAQSVAVEAVIDQLRVDCVQADGLLQAVAGAAIEIANAVRRRGQELVRPALELVEGRKRRLEAGERSARVRAKDFIARTDLEGGDVEGSVDQVVIRRIVVWIVVVIALACVA